MTEQPKLVFITDDLAAYERIDPDEFPNYDEVDSRDILDEGAPPTGDDE